MFRNHFRTNTASTKHLNYRALLATPQFTVQSLGFRITRSCPNLVNDPKYPVTNIDSGSTKWWRCSNLHRWRHKSCWWLLSNKFWQYGPIFSRNNATKYGLQWTGIQKLSFFEILFLFCHLFIKCSKNYLFYKKIWSKFFLINQLEMFLIFQCQWSHITVKSWTPLVPNKAQQLNTSTNLCRNGNIRPSVLKKGCNMGLTWNMIILKVSP